MRKIGLVGGMSWHSTLEYYRVLNEQVAATRGGHASARVVLESLDFAEIRECQQTGDWRRAGRLLAEAALRCQASGAEVVVICTNLMHRVADEVEAALDVPLLHIADAIADAAHARGWSQVGVLGTSWVAAEDFYVGRLARNGLRVHVPSPDEQTEIDRVIFEELTLGRVEEPSRAAYAEVIGRLRDAGAEAVVLACTEVGLLVRPEDSVLPLLDSADIHAEAAAAFAVAEPAGVS
ncbi:amino acid racemase [Nocardioides sp.]|uniref:aspartate/glutamate racemase family protein n=1 Tax=Nocardioides sp. TaxID=35761 RepID=UPI001A1B900D|nr:amino acid racemase [Nocardioides sp.]MBJ7358242.1 amino acid racemase [Nocardioides sp.]